jgi:hypothetical protein
LICIPFSLFALISFWTKPRLWLHSLPTDIQQKTNPKTKEEKQLTQFMLLPIFLIILPGLSVASLIYMGSTMIEDITLIGALIHLYGIWAFVHLWDLLIIDGISMLIIDKNHPPIPGTEGAAGWSDFGFHFRSFLKAVVFSAFFVLPAAFIISVLM